MLGYVTWRRLEPNTKDGEQIEITTRYTSFDKKDIDIMQKWCEEKYGSGIMIDAGTPMEDDD